ncbi:SCP2 sterol-binding domain-containing protein [Fluviispira multicolorata]|uniref:SCP2 domain-containing protein n=1 Tax=Fluviispira multicolorata TaxID=2654512 RepID=A0A833N6N6_9BACT|nr:SCP2 sterol-binding domain-containing protein [Fluviispira multicolorata]KAB8033715.1 hypothetical protein GCL57_03135 [Fluviispira multicolorata]
MELLQNLDSDKNHLTEEQRLRKIADGFRYWVCSELRNLEFSERIFLRGDYLFAIDGKPRFVVMIDELGAWSVALSGEDNALKFVVDEKCPWKVDFLQIKNVIEGSSRATILTDSSTLHKLLIGTLKARIAFVTGKVTITGDLAAFLKMVSILKRNGVKPGV